MKKNSYVLSLFALSFFFLFSCSKYNKMLDVEWDDLGVEGYMNWGIPLINADYGIGKILDYFDGSGYVQTDPNNNYFREYIVPREEEKPIEQLK